MSISIEQTWCSMSTSLDARSEPRHRWYWAKEGFSPFLVQTAIDAEQCKGTDLIVDPFCGSGTVPLEALRCQLATAGAEVNPFLAFAANAKTLTPKLSAISIWRDRARQAVYKGAYSPLIGYSTFARTRQKRGLFNQSVLKGFRSAWLSLEAAPETTKKILRLSLLRAVLDCANFSRDGKALRYREALMRRQFGRQDFDVSFSSRVEEVIEDIDSILIPSTLPNIEITDSRHNLSKRFQGFKLCVTSPPYLNSFDYTDVYRPELFLGGIRSVC